MSLVHSIMDLPYPHIAALLWLHGAEISHEEHVSGMEEDGGGMELGFHKIVTYQD
jgi:hypothetical protein